MNKIKAFVFFCLYIGGVQSWSQSDLQSEYASRIQQFKETYRTQVTVIYPTELQKLGADPAEIQRDFLPPALHFLNSVEEKVDRLVQLHSAIFLEGKRDKALSSEMNLIESNLVFVTEVGIRNLMQILLEAQSGQRDSRKIRSRLQHLNLLAEEISSGREINSKSKSNLLSLLDIRQTIPGQMLRLGCSYVAQVCIRRKPIGDWLHHVGEKGYSQRKGAGFETLGFEAARSLPENAVVVVVSNHQDGALDVAIPNRLGQSLGLDGGLKLLAHSSNYPLVQHMNQGSEILFTDRGDWQAEALASFDSPQNEKRRMGVIVYPEGLVSGPLSQFPLITKVGALSAARKWAHRFAGNRPVYLAVLTTNAHAFNTAIDFKPLQVRLESLERVPTAKPGVPDAWIETQRLKIENAFNQSRDEKADLQIRAKTPGMHGLYETVSDQIILETAKSCRIMLGP